jgi:hypothetical protein
MSAFVSIDGKLSLPSAPHPDDGKYNPIEVSKPVCIEILHLAFGEIRDWWGKSEILVSSWSKTGGTAKPGARKVNLLRKNIPKFHHLSDLGAAEYGHNLIYYTPVYGREPIRFSVEFLEIDKLGGDGITKLGQALQNLGGLPVFAPQLSFLAAAPQILELGRKLYDIFNRNDVALLEHLDLSKDPDSNILTSGRYVLVRGSHNALTFVERYKLEKDNKLYTQDNRLAEEAGLKDPYLVIRINAVEKKEYENFEFDSAAQEIMDTVLNQGVNESIAELLSEGVKATKHFAAAKRIMELKLRLDKTGPGPEKQSLKAAINLELKRLTTEQIDLFKEALGLV